MKKNNIMEISDKLDIIKNVILSYVNAKFIYLFGSRVWGNPTEDSDIDIYAVIPDSFNKKITFTIGNIINDLCNKDLLTVHLYLVKEEKYLHYIENSSFEEKIYKEGILIYEEN